MEQGAFDGHLVNGMGVLGAIVTAGSFVRASELLDMSPSGVTRAIARLEQRLGVRLLNRSTRAVSLTDEGRRLYERIAPLLEALTEAAGDAGSATAVPRGKLRLNADPFFSRLLLAPRLAAFCERHPGVELEILTRDHLGDLVGDGFDVAVRFGPPPESSLVARELLSTRIITVAAPSYLARRGRPETPQALLDEGHTCIQFRDPTTGRPFPWEFHRGGERVVLETRGPVTLNDAAMLHALTLAGQGISQMMALGCGRWLADGDLVELFPDWPDETFPLYALWPSRRLLPARVRVFLEFIVEVGQQASVWPPA